MQKSLRQVIVRGSIGIFICIFLFSISGCYDPFGPTPEATHAPAALAWTNADVDAMVVMEQKSIYSPAPRENGTPPAECDYIKFLRFRLKGSSTGTGDKDAMLLMMPGLLEGANGFEYIARQLIYVAKKEYGLNIEVWAVDRRNNNLEDLTGFAAAQTANNADTALQTMLDYYYNGKAINGKTFQGYLTSKDTPYLSEFGLKMDTEDMFKIIQTMVPDPAERRKKVFVGGHSMGGMHTSLFAGWDLDGDPKTLDDAGYMNCAGLFAFDSTVAPIDGIVDNVLKSLEPFVPKEIVGFGKNMTELVYLGGVDLLRCGIIPRFIDGSITGLALGTPLDAEIMSLIQAQAMMAHMAPNQESSALHKIPISKNLKKVLNQYQARTMEQYDNNKPSMLDYRYTNEAMFGVFFDDSFTHIPMIRCSMGFLVGGPVDKKDWTIDIISNNPLMQYSVLYVATDAGPDLKHLGQGPLYKWANFDTIGTLADPNFTDTTGNLTYTTMKEEVADIQDVARALYIGPTNLVEWYFSIRRLLDVMAAIMPYGPKYGLNYIHSDKITSLPKIEFGAGSGLFGNLTGDGTVILEGFNHMDPMFAAANRPGHRKNEVIYPLIDFVQKNMKK